MAAIAPAGCHHPGQNMTYTSTGPWFFRARRECMDSIVTSEERRKATRFGHDEIEDIAVLFWRESRLRVDVLDESLGGIRVLVPSAMELPVGLELEVLYVGQKSRGIVRHVHARPGGGFVVGIECRPIA